MTTSKVDQVFKAKTNEEKIRLCLKFELEADSKNNLEDSFYWLGYRHGIEASGVVIN